MTITMDWATAMPVDEPARWSDDDLLRRCRALEDRRRADLAEHVRLLAELEQRHLYADDGHRDLAAFGRAEYRWSDSDAKGHRDLERLARQCPQVLDRLDAGRLGTAQAFLLARVARAPRVGHLLVEAIDEFLDEAATRSYRDLEGLLVEWRALVDQDGRDPDWAHRARSVRFGQTGTTALISISGPSIDLARLRAALEPFEQHELACDRHAAAEQWGDGPLQGRLPRTTVQRRYDAFMRLVSTTAGPDGDDANGTMVNIVVDGPSFVHGLERLLGLGGRVPLRSPFGPDRAFCHTFDGDPIGLRDAVVAALAGRVRIVTRAANGLPVSISSASRLFTGALRDAVLLTATSCTHPGCNVPASRCQIDHLQPVHRGGVTSVRNGAVACGHHNRWRYAAGVTVVRLVDGTIATYRPNGTRVAGPD